LNTPTRFAPVLSATFTIERSCNIGLGIECLHFFDDNLDPGYALRKLAANAKWSGEWDGKAFRKDARGRYEAFAPTGTFKLSVQYSTKAKMMIGDAYGSLEPPVQTLESPEFTISPR
jgi:hypothetical protein